MEMKINDLNYDYYDFKGYNYAREHEEAEFYQQKVINTYESLKYLIDKNLTKEIDPNEFKTAKSIHDGQGIYDILGLLSFWSIDNLKIKDNSNFVSYLLNPKKYMDRVYDLDYGKNWIKQRKKALIRDNYTCQKCGKTAKELGKNPDVHHKKPIRTFSKDEIESKANDLDNLITLCRSCHSIEEMK